MSSSSESDGHIPGVEAPMSSAPKTGSNITNMVKLKQRNKQFNRRRWNKFKGMAEDWINKQGSSVPPFVIMRLNKGVVEWGGPSFMEEFVTDKVVMETFKKASMARPVSFGCKKGSSAPQKLLKSQPNISDVDSKTLPVSSLRLLITDICNPKRINGFWQHEENKPSWWPEDIPFQSPNWVPAGGAKMRVGELVSVFDAYKSASNTKAEPVQFPPSTPSAPPAASTSAVSAMEKEVLDNIKKGHYRACLQLLQTVPYEDLEAICNAFLPTLTAMKPVTGNFTMSDFPSSMLDQRRTKLARMPRNYAAVVSTGDGDCLFNSLSLLLKGTEEAAQFVRLAAAAYGVCHASHYASMYFEECQDLQQSCAFMHMMGTAPPPSIEGWSSKDVVKYAVERQAAATCSSGSYSGILQIVFSAGFLHVFIQQHCEDPAPGYDTLINPCPCEEQDSLPVLHLMWVKSSVSGTMNHFVPLVPRRVKSRYQSTNAPHDASTLAQVLQNFCAACMGTVNMCQVDKRQLDTWVQCEECARWYHCLCAGLSCEVANSLTFICCTMDCTNRIAVLDGTYMTVGDINRLRAREDLSGDAIDFFMRYLMMKSKNSNTVVLPYFVGQLFHQRSWLHSLGNDAAKARMKEHLRSLGTCGLHLSKKENILIPVCVSKHWIGVVVQRKTNMLLILDSLHGFLTADTYRQLLRFVIRYLYMTDACTSKIAAQELELGMDLPMVKQQENAHDCGVFLIASFEAFLLGGLDHLKTMTSSSTLLRRQLLGVAHACSKI